MYTLNMLLNAIISALMVMQAAFALPFNSAVFYIDNKASVFESGDEMYTVIWSTTLPGTGYVTYTYEGVEYVVKDLQNSAVRTTEEAPGAVPAITMANSAVKRKSGPAS